MESATIQSFSRPNHSNRLFIVANFLRLWGDYHCTVWCDCALLRYNNHHMSAHFQKGWEWDFSSEVIKSTSVLMNVSLSQGLTAASPEKVWRIPALSCALQAHAPHFMFFPCSRGFPQCVTFLRLNTADQQVGCVGNSGRLWIQVWNCWGRAEMRMFGFW